MAVQFGVSFHPYPVAMPSASLAIDFAQAAEELGFDSLWVGDHILWRTPLLEPLTLLAALSSVTRRIRLGTGVLLLPLRQPAIVAKMVATLDYLSGGRAILGVGIGGENPKEFEVCGVPVTERGRRADEAIEVLRALWLSSEACYEGRFLRFSGADMQPKPVQRPGPAIWIGGRSEPALRRVARLGDGWLDYFVTAQGFRDAKAKIGAYAAEFQRGREIAAAHSAMIYVAPTKEAAKNAAEGFLANYYDHAFRFLLSRYCALGTPEECAAKIKAYIEAGADNIIVAPACGPQESVAQLELIAKEVIPVCRQQNVVG